MFCTIMCILLVFNTSVARTSGASAPWVLPVTQRRRQSTASRGAIVKFRGAHGERGARAYKGGLGA